MENEITVNENDDLISTRDAAQLSGFHIEHIRRLLRRGEIRGKRFGAVWMVSRQSLQDYLSNEEKRKSGPHRLS